MGMNYLVAVDTFFPDRPSGSARVAWDIAQLMRDRGHNVTILCRKQRAGDADTSEHEGVTAVRYDAARTFSLAPWKLEAHIGAAGNTAKRYLADTRWDVIHIHLPTQGNAVYRVFGRGPTYVYTVHSPVMLEQQINWAAQGLPGRIKWLFGRGQLRRLEGGLLTKVQRIHTLSQFTKNKIAEAYGLGDKITVIPHWCRTDFVRCHSKQRAREILQWPEDARIFFSVRRLVSRMGLDVAIRAVAGVMQTDPGVRFALAGAGEMEESLKQLAQSTGVGDRIWFLGRVDDETLKRCYEAADLFVLPTLSLECFGLIVLEALAFGLPIISTDAGALPELLEPIMPQCIVPAGNVDVLQKTIRLFTKGQLEVPTSEQLSAYVAQGYSFETIAPQIETLLTPQAG